MRGSGLILKVSLRGVEPSPADARGLQRHMEDAFFRASLPASAYSLAGKEPPFVLSGQARTNANLRPGRKDENRISIGREPLTARFEVLLLDQELRRTPPCPPHFQQTKMEREVLEVHRIPGTYAPGPRIDRRGRRTPGLRGVGKRRGGRTHGVHPRKNTGYRRVLRQELLSYIRLFITKPLY